MQAHRPEALEGYIQMLVRNIQGAVGQIDRGQHKAYDANTRQDILESLLAVVKTRKEQRDLDPAGRPLPARPARGFAARLCLGSWGR